MKLKSSMAAFAVASILSAPAGATDLLDGLRDPAPQGTSISWTGISFGVHGGYSNSNHKIEANGETATDICSSESGSVYTGAGGWHDGWCDLIDGKFIPAETPVSALLDGLNSPGFFGGIDARVDIQRGNFLFGVFGDYNLSEASSEFSLSVDGLPVGTAGIEEGDSWVAAARLGYLFGADDRALFYVLLSLIHI